MLAGSTGAFASMLWMWLVRTGKPDPSMMCNGMLAGLVAITAPCAFVNAPAACLIGTDCRRPGRRGCLSLLKQAQG
jgi:Amt family ammonium transporter